jgi:hypothetical protein
MDRRAALAELQKATITTGNSAASLLSPEQSDAFIRVIKDKSGFGDAIQLIRRRAASGEINKISSGARLLRGKAENADDGYRAGVDFPEVEYDAKKWWLPWEVTEDEFHENIEEERIEAKITAEMTDQAALDWDDLDVNGDTAAGAGPDQAFLQINDGLLKLAEDNDSGNIHRVDATDVGDGSGDLVKEHFFSAIYAMPNKYRAQGQLRFFLSPNRSLSWMEYLTDRETAAGDAALLAAAQVGNKPLNIEFFEVPSFPDDRIVLTAPNNLARVVTWDVRRRKVTGDTDWELATRDKRGYLIVAKSDFIILEDDALVDVHDFSAVDTTPS